MSSSSRTAFFALVFAIFGVCQAVLAAAPSPPENSPAQVQWNRAKGQLRLRYHDQDILDAYFADFTEKDLEEVAAAMAEKRLADFGYRFLQIDDTFQGGSGTPDSWLKWNTKFPKGRRGYVEIVRGKGFEPGIWLGVNFRDEAIVRTHPQWFVRKPDGTPLKAPWVDFGVDATIPEAADTLVRPTYRGVKESGFPYVKIDALRHLLYDSLHCAPEHGRDRGLSGDVVFRRYLAVARDEVGPQTFILACWGVLPEVIGIADGCRLGGDGFGPATLQQYNSWNGVVWRNDPDACDVLAGGNMAGTILRPSIVSMAGAMLLLSDRAAVYRRDECLEGAKRSSPVLFTVPGQLYDFEPDKSDWLLTHQRNEIKAGGPASPMDARQSDNVCPWWLLEVDRPFEHWTVLAHYNWTGKSLPQTSVRFTDLGLEQSDEYLVYEFWTKQFLGICREQFTAEELAPNSVRMYAIRHKLDRPQVVSTSRHPLGQPEQVGNPQVYRPHSVEPVGLEVVQTTLDEGPFLQPVPLGQRLSAFPRPVNA
jgi:alpha-galactosidase